MSQHIKSPGDVAGTSHGKKAEKRRVINHSSNDMCGKCGNRLTEVFLSKLRLL